MPFLVRDDAKDRSSLPGSGSHDAKNLPTDSALVGALLGQRGVAVALAGFDRRILQCNDRFAALVGRPADEMVGLHFSAITHADDLDIDRSKAAQLIAGQIDSYTSEKRWVHRDGSCVWGRLTVSAVRGPRRQPQCALVIVEDIHAAREAVDRRLESETRFARLVEASPDPIVVHRNLKVMFANQAAAETLGASCGEQLIGQDLGRYVHEDDRPALGRQVAEVMAGRGPLRLEHRIYRGDGGIAQMQTVHDRLEFDGVPAIVTLARDVTARRDAEQAARRSSQRLRALFNHGPIAALLWEVRGDDLVLADMNSAAMEMSDNQGGRSMGARARALYADDPRLLRSLEDCRAGRFVPSWTMAYRIRASGVVKPARITCAPVAEGLVVQYLQDLSSERHAEESCRRAMDELLHVKQLAVESKAMASLVHETAQPITSASGLVHAAASALDRETDASGARNLLQRAAEEIDRVASVMGRMRKCLQRPRSCPGPVDLRRLAERVVQRARTEADRAGVQLLLEAPMPAAMPMPEAWLDGVRIDQALTNLVRNAIDAASAAPADRRDVRVRLTMPDEQSVAIAVIDRGPGLGGDEPHRIFEPFFTTKPDGMGMGLSICQTIVESHGGQLTVETPEAGGCVFRVRLPRRPAADPPADPSTDPAGEAGRQSPGQEAA